MHKDRKVIVIAVDGGTFTLLRPLMDKGKMPNLKEIFDHGAGGELRTIYPPITPSAFASFATGKNPGKTGIYGFVNVDPRTSHFNPVNSRMRKGATIWDLVGNAGGRVVVMNIPVTYPPPNKVNGVLISDFLTPFGKTDYGCPLEELREIEKKFGKYPIYLRYAGMALALNLNERSFVEFMKECFLELNYKFQVLNYLRQKHSPNLVAMHLYANDQISHTMWHVLDKSHPLFNDTLEKKFKDRIIEYYMALDSKFGELINTVDENTLLMIMSDHGFGPTHKMICPDTWLLNQGFIVLKKTPLTSVRKFLWDSGITHELLFSRFRKIIYRRFKNLTEEQQIRYGATKRRAFISLNDVDWSKTKAFPGFIADFYVNSKERFYKGCVEPKDYASVRESIISKLKEMEDPDTGRRIEGTIVTLEEAFKGDNLSSAPDLIYLPLESNYFPASWVSFQSRKTTTKTWLLPGNHRMEGIFAMYGEGVSKGKVCRNSNLIDLAPTILFFLGVPIPKSMDGRMLEEPFEESFLRDNKTVLFDEVTEQEETAAGVYTKEEEQSVLEHLKQLGYVD